MSVIPHHGVSPRIHSTAFLTDSVWIIGDVVIMEESSIWYGTVLRGDINRISVGRRSNIQDGCVVHVTQTDNVEIADEVTVGHRAVIHGCMIGSHSLIGMGAVILDRARVGRHTLVAAGSVVREGFVVPDGMLAAGVPARIVRELTDRERHAIEQSAAHYVTYASSYR
jgi:carbonic anhydrase/acetyltransferase-like protein (isoleucine patch superfamily)